jgi:hypothetical protein
LGLDKQEDEVHDTKRAIETVIEAIRILVGESKQG